MRVTSYYAYVFLTGDQQFTESSQLYLQGSHWLCYHCR